MKIYSKKLDIEFDCFVCGIYAFVEQTGKVPRTPDVWELIAELLSDVMQVGKSLESAEMRRLVKLQNIKLTRSFLGDAFLRRWAVRQLKVLGMGRQEIFDFLSYN